MTPPSDTPSVFRTNRRIRIGIWGLGRGTSFYNSLRALNFDVVAGCDFNEFMREDFLKSNPGAWVTADAEKFLKGDFEAVLLATFCPSHGGDALACLRHGKHVLSEVTAFTTPAEGVELYETAERSGLVYNLAENYPFSAANMYLRSKWEEGLFGDLMYAEYEYVHEIVRLAYSYNRGVVPIVPGNTVHNWRSWINFHYYNTHSLGPVMYITGLRPTRVVSLPTQKVIPGAIRAGTNGHPAPSLITLSNGGLMRNLMGQLSGDTAHQRIWGTHGYAEIDHQKLTLRLGGRGHAPAFEMEPTWKEMAELARVTGHGGGDFWVIYYFARQILEGTPAPFDLATAVDCTLPGILAYRSALENGTPQEIPDFRDPAQRDRYRDDHFRQEHFDPERDIFPEGADPARTERFCRIMCDLIAGSAHYRAWRDWNRVKEEMKEPEKLAPLRENLAGVLTNYRATLVEARRLADAYPESIAHQVLTDLLEFGGETHVLGKAIEAELA